VIDGFPPECRSTALSSGTGYREAAAFPFYGAGGAGITIIIIDAIIKNCQFLNNTVSY